MKNNDKRRKPNIFAEDKISHINRIIRNEKYVMLPIKVLAVLLSGLALYFEERSIGTAQQTYRWLLSLYALSNLFFLYLLLQVGQPQSNLTVVRLTSYLLSIIDNLYLCYMVYNFGGVESQLFWLYCGLMVRNSANFPSLIEQGILNLAFGGFYVGIISVNQDDFGFMRSELFITRIIVLILVSFCSWGVLNLLRQRKAESLASQELLLRREKFSSQVRLASEVAHELKNPLGIINNALFIAKRRLAKSVDDPVVSKQFSIISSEIERSDRIITDLLGYARMRDGGVAETDVNEVLERAINSVFFSEEEQSSAISVERDYAHNLPNLLIDPGQLLLVFINLLRNAAEAADKPQPRITVRTMLDEMNKILTVSIHDNGRGIAAEYLDRVFDSFVSTKQAGTGLGLAIVRNIIEANNATINLASREGQGTLIEVGFPLVIMHTLTGQERQ